MVRIDEISNREVINNIKSIRSEGEYKAISPGIFKPFAHSKVYDVYGEVDYSFQLTEFENAKVVNEFREADTNTIIYLLKEDVRPKWLTDNQIMNTEYNLIIVYYDSLYWSIVFLVSYYSSDNIFFIKLIYTTKYDIDNRNPPKTSLV